ncbi:MAG: site-specific DNA-methyltransferase [Leptospiraceae bacterium]|nr:site-specific DNA-methyltransferase [Leptospiraceae bacterium]
MALVNSFRRPFSPINSSGFLYSLINSSRSSSFLDFVFAIFFTLFYFRSKRYLHKINYTFHPAPFPVALIERIISSTSAELILDPFSGSGTTALVSKALNRNYIGIELSPDYCEMSERRIKENGMNCLTSKAEYLSLFSTTK